MTIKTEIPDQGNKITPIADCLAAVRAHHDDRIAAATPRDAQRITDKFWKEQNARQAALVRVWGA
jgi:hypothetical protein